jgi:protein transport protein SEC24
LRKIKGLSIAGTIRWLYPSCIKLHTWFEQPGDLLPLERTSYDRLDPAGMYWIQSHHAIFLWIGKHASSELVESVFGTADINQINPHMSKLPELEHSVVNQQLRELYHKNTDNLPYLPQLNVIRHGMDLEVELSKVLVEDETFGQMSYVDYLCMIHRQIQAEV